MIEPIHLLSLGAGVQSTTLLLMQLAGEFDWTPDAAIFADTGAEGDHVYAQVDFLEQEIAGRYPLYRVSAGNLETDLLDAVNKRRGRVANPPFHVINREGTVGTDGQREHSAGSDLGGMLWRSCTRDYKLDPIRRKMREIHKAAGRRPIVQHIGISRDEMERMRESGVKYITNSYPLVDAKLTRHDCLLWLQRHEYPIPGKSACHFCPYRSNQGWREMKQSDPATFARAVEFDERLRDGKLPGVTGDAYVHRSFIPLGMVDLTSAEENGQMGLFGDGLINECEGLCGV